ncbi:hypothetical protein CFC21_026021 [Triticum aestivum]|uniref:Uncharacterized protein n=2 Tax=Triticum aestivum TaxID=4565 RepID=A0A3B6CEX3_WHEAT|nr:hypothetical protein CFC21_026021 [Triticum aestivum]
MASKVFAMLAIVLVLTHGHLPAVMGQTTPPDRPKYFARQDAAPAVAGNGAAAGSGFTEEKGWFFQRPLARPTPLPPSLKL